MQLAPAFNPGIYYIRNKDFIAEYSQFPSDYAVMPPIFSSCFLFARVPTTRRHFNKKEEKEEERREEKAIKLCQ